jgi:glutathione S-transferase
MRMLRIWGRVNSINVQKAMWAIAELGLPHERTDAGGAFGGLDTPEYKAKNPNSRIPTIDDHGVIVWESNTVVRYLAARYGAGTLWPIDPARRSEADRWMDWQQTTLAPDMFPVFWGLIRTPPEKRYMAVIKAAGERLAASWLLLEKQMGDRAFVAGNELTMGDIPVGCAFWRYSKLDVAKPALPKCNAWHQRLQERPGFRQHVAMPLS